MFYKLLSLTHLSVCACHYGRLYFSFDAEVGCCFIITYHDGRYQKYCVNYYGTDKNMQPYKQRVLVVFAVVYGNSYPVVEGGKAT